MPVPSQGHYCFHSFPVVDWFCLFICLWDHLHQQSRVTWSILTTKVNVKNTFTSHIDNKYFWHFCWLPYLDTFSLYENSSFIIVSAETEYISNQVRVITVFTVFRLLTDFVCLYAYEFWLSLWKIVRSSVILLLPLFPILFYSFN
jgi:hypothetical protein